MEKSFITSGPGDRCKAIKALLTRLSLSKLRSLMDVFIGPEGKNLCFYLLPYFLRTFAI